MKSTRIGKSALIGALMLICFAAGSYAANGIQEVKAFLRDDLTIIIDGRPIILENSVLIHENYSYLPLRELGLMLNVDVDWNDADRTVIITSPPVVEASAPAPSGNNSDNTTGNTSGSGNLVQYPSEIQFTNVINYRITLDNKDYYLLANEQEGVMYFRKSDVDKMNLDLSGLRTVKEKHTSELYYPAGELSLRLQNPGKFEVSNEVIIRETNAEKVKALKLYTPNNSSYVQAFYIRALSGNNEYEILFRGADKRFYVYIIKLAAHTNGTFYVNHTRIDYLYD